MGWQPIETAPEDELVLTINNIPDAIVPWVASFDSDEGKWVSFGSAYENLMKRMSAPRDFQPTHWMPLPEPPEGEK